MKKYSEFINFPIYLWASKEVDVEVPADEEDSSDEDEKRMYNLTSCYDSVIPLLELFPVSNKILCCNYYGLCPSP